MQLSGQLPQIGSYAEALAYFTRTPARTGRSYKIRTEGSGKGNTYTVTGMWKENERPLNTTNPYLGYTRMIVDSDGDIRMRYHDTDVVTYHPKGTVTVHPWDSISTDTFYRALGPTGTFSHFASNPSDLLMLYDMTQPASEYGWRSQGKLYQLDGRTRIHPNGDGSWWLDEIDTIPFEWPTYHPDRSKRLREFDLAGLRSYLLITLHHMVGKRDMLHDETYTTSEIIALVADEKSWLTIATQADWLHNMNQRRHGQRNRWGRDLPNDIESRVERFMRSLRNMLYAELGIVTIEKRPYLTSHGQVTALNQLVKRYEVVNL